MSHRVVERMAQLASNAADQSAQMLRAVQNAELAVLRTERSALDRHAKTERHEKITRRIEIVILVVSLLNLATQPAVVQLLTRAFYYLRGLLVSH